MFGPPRPLIPNMHLDHHIQRHSHNPQWRHLGPGRPRTPFRGQHQRFNQHRPPFQSGNDNYWCETCDRGFPTNDTLNNHKLQHQKCNIDGCQFIAHPKVITKHIQMQHSSGIYKKIANINKPEDIEKWRAERKKKYPTKTNIDKKAAELKEKIERGEKMGLERNRFPHKNNQGYNKDNRPGQGFKRRKDMGNENQPRSKFKRNNATHNNLEKKPQPKGPPKPKTLPLIEENRKLKPFSGILHLQMDSYNEIEDDNTELNDLIENDDCEEFKTVEIKSLDASEPVVCGALNSLMHDYGSSDEENKEIVNNLTIKPLLPEDVSNVKISKGNQDLSHMNKHLKENIKCETKIKNYDTAECRKVINKPSSTQNINEDDDCGPEEVKIIKETITIIPEDSKPKDVVVRKKAVTEKKSIFRQPKPKLPSTLLYKLLFKEMQQERNIVLQCIRYIKRNNYFDKQE